MSSAAGFKYTLAVRMLLADSGFGDNMPPMRLSSRWLAERYAMLRYGAENHLIAPRFVDAEDNVADLLTKPLTGETFIRLRRIALGTA